MKACPVCGAGAFDDASTCFGCLHRYDRQEPPRVAEPAAEAMRPAPLPGPAVAREAASPRCVSAAPPLAAVREEAPSADAEAPVRDEPGWIVRFELPERPRGGCELLRGEGREGRSACDLIVRFQSAAPDGSEERRRIRGSHARALETGTTAVQDACVLASVPARVRERA